MPATVQYNGYDFPKQSSVSIVMRNEYDETDRVLVAKQLVITVRAFILPVSGAQTDATRHMQDIRNLLSRPGMSLVIRDIGFGIADLVINTEATGATWDIRNGPKPREISWAPIGAASAAEITWQCETWISPCNLSTYAGVTAINYGIFYIISPKGFTTRTIHGYLTIAQTQREDSGGAVFGSGVEADWKNRTGDSQWADDDVWRDRLQFPILPNFERIQNFSLSTDKSRLDFNVVDREIESPNAYPPDVVSIQAPTSIKVGYPSPDLTGPNTMTLGVRLELTQQANRLRAWEIFNAILGWRLGGTLNESRKLVARDMVINEDWFTNEYEFFIRLTGGMPLNALFAHTSMFRVIPTNWTEWSESLAPNRYHRGLAQLGAEVTGEKDPLINLCNSSAVSPLEEYRITIPQQSYLSQLCNTLPSEESSWQKFNSKLYEKVNHQRYSYATYGKPEIEINEFNWKEIPQEGKPVAKVKQGNVKLSVANAYPNIHYLWTGRVERLAYPIPPPGKISIGGMEAEIVGEHIFHTRSLGYSFCHEVFEAEWRIELALKETPDKISGDDIDPTNVKKQKDDPPEDSRR